MRSTRFRTKLLAYFWLILIMALGIPTYYIYHALEKEILQEETQNGFVQLDLVDWMFHQHSPFEDMKQLNAWCIELGQKLKYRITLISENGKVVADSSVPFNDIGNLENHGCHDIAGSGQRFSTDFERRNFDLCVTVFKSM